MNQAKSIRSRVLSILHEQQDAENNVSEQINVFLSDTIQSITFNDCPLDLSKMIRSYLTVDILVSFIIKGNDHTGYCSGADADYDPSCYAFEKVQMESKQLPYEIAEKVRHKPLQYKIDFIVDYFGYELGRINRCTSIGGTGYCNGMYRDTSITNVIIGSWMEEEICLS